MLRPTKSNVEKCGWQVYPHHHWRYTKSHKISDNDRYERHGPPHPLRPNGALLCLGRGRHQQRRSFTGIWAVNSKTHYYRLTLSHGPSLFHSFTVKVWQSQCSLYTSVEKRMLCRLLSGVGIVSSCRKYSNTWTCKEAYNVRDNICNWN